MDLDNIKADIFGKTLTGLGLNLIVRDVPRHVSFLKDNFDMKAFRATNDFAILKYTDQIFQLHADHTYGRHPLFGILPENPPRGAGIEIRLYNSDPDECHRRAVVRGIVFCIHPLISPTAFGNAQSYPMMDTSGYHLDHLQSEFVTTMV